MMQGSLQAAPSPNDAPPGLVSRLVLGAGWGLGAAQQRARMHGREGWRALVCLVRMLWLAGRPVLFLVSLCLGAAGLLALVDGLLGIMFLLAGFSALSAFAVLARRPAGDPWARQLHKR